MGVKFLDIPRMGYFILFKGDGSWISEQIVKEQLKAGFSPEDSLYTHVAVSGGGQWIVEVSLPYIKVIDFTSKYKGRYICIVKYKDRTYGKRRYKVAFFAASHCNLPYDLAGLLAFKFNWLMSHWKRLYFCSENGLWALQKEYPTALNSMKPNKCMPADFLSKDFEIVWEGVI